MTEIPEHLRKRAAEARQKAAGPGGASGDPTRIPAHLLERATAVSDTGGLYPGPESSASTITPGLDRVPDMDFVCDRPESASNGPLFAVAIILILIIAIGVLLFVRSSPDGADSGYDPATVSTTIPGAIILPSCDSLTSFDYTGPKVSCLDSNGNLTTMGE